MQKNKVIIVHLRRPKSKAQGPDEMRSDPFWEFGSFGITKCHKRNLMHHKNTANLNGARFAFAQGGKQGTRLVYLTPPVRIVEHKDHRIEAIWKPHTMPFRYCDAPLLVSNANKSDFSLLKSALSAGRSQTLEGQFGSNYRSRGEPLETHLADELVRVYTDKLKNAPASAFANCYSDALPWPPPKVDKEREQTYSQKLSEARGSKDRSVCGSRKRTRCGGAPSAD